MQLARDDGTGVGGASLRTDVDAGGTTLRQEWMRAELPPGQMQLPSTQEQVMDLGQMWLKSFPGQEWMRALPESAPHWTLGLRLAAVPQN